MQPHKGKGFQLIGMLALCALLYSGNARAEDAAALAARLHTTAAASSIDTPGSKPWHLKMSVQLYNAKSKPTEQGTVEEWWAGPDLNRVTYTTPSYTGTQLRNKNGVFRTKSQTYEPAILRDVLEQVVHPISHEEDIDQAKPDLRKEKFGQVELECIMLDQPLNNVAYPPMGLFPTFCLDPGKDNLRVSTGIGSLIFLRNHEGIFRGKFVAVDVLAQTSDQPLVASAHIDSLTNMPLTDADFVPGADLEPVMAKAVFLDTEFVKGRVLSKVEPRYPEISKQNHVAGTVVMRAIIGYDGRIQSLHLIPAPDANLAIAAIKAVRNWTYKPYLLNGVPAEVETVITVTFDLR